MTYSSSRLSVPDGFPEILQGLAREVLRHQPTDIISFACDHFNKLAADRVAEKKLEQAIENSNTTDCMKPNPNAVVVDNQEELPEVQSFDDKDVKAVIKIQSNIRGMQARKKVNDLKEEKQLETKMQNDQVSGDKSAEPIALENNESDQKEAEKLPDLNSFEQSDIDKITKLQAGFRGMAVRKNKNQAEETSDNKAHEESKAEHNQTSTTPEQELEDVEKIDIKGTDEEIAAATKIQAHFKGMQVRNKQKDDPNDRPETQAEEIIIPETPTVDQSRPETAATQVEIPQTPKQE